MYVRSNSVDAKRAGVVLVVPTVQTLWTRWAVMLALPGDQVLTSDPARQHLAPGGSNAAGNPRNVPTNQPSELLGDFPTHRTTHHAGSLSATIGPFAPAPVPWHLRTWRDGSEVVR